MSPFVAGRGRRRKKGGGLRELWDNPYTRSPREEKAHVREREREREREVPAQRIRRPRDRQGSR